MLHVSDCLVWLIAVGSILCVLMQPRGWAEAWWACGGALLLVVTTLVPWSQAVASVRQGLDVYLFLTGMMILSELAREKGVFDWIAEEAAIHAAGSPRRLFFLIYLSGTAVTALLSNDATAVVLTPAVLTIVRRLKIEPVPHLLACALIANAASFVLPISNPANLVIYGNHMPPLVTWLRAFFLPSLVSIVLTFASLRFVTRENLRGDIGVSLPKTKLSTDGRLAMAGLGLAAFVLIGASALGWPLGAPTCAAALLASLIVTCRDRTVPRAIVRGVAWSVLPLVAGLFVIVGALQNAGGLRLAVAGLDAARNLAPVVANLVTAFSVGLLSNVMNNLPVGLIGGRAVQVAHDHGSLAHAVLIGVDLGPNLSVTGSLATILWLVALRRENVKISGRKFFTVGLVVMPIALLGSILVLGK